MESGKLVVWARSDRLALPLAVVLLAVLTAIVTLFAVVFSTIRVEGESMAPSLHSGDRLLMTRGYPTPKAGDVVAFPVIDGAGVVSDVLVKRVVAIAGDDVQVSGDTVFVNGKPSSVASTAYIDPNARWDIELTVPDGHVFVMGDNRPIALDSRQLGPVPTASIRGKAVAIIVPLSRAGVID